MRRAPQAQQILLTREIQELRIFPNPVKELMVVELNSKAYQGELTLELFDLSGKLIMQTMVLAQGQNFTDLSKIPNGMYLYAIRLGEIKLKMNKILVLH